ncbi:tlde1 domain-containing protein [Cupriavidus campinensis]|uniref:tlde1 domain-containing protein n=1 Tax=Cupriavidus TaxID=106589 RepID=UPI001FD5C6A0|nr:tlde1 domain-containing protein [Cupriavidus campinensis]
MGLFYHSEWRHAVANDWFREMLVIPDMKFDGQVLSWIGSGTFKATTGLAGHQHPNNQCVKDSGPIPEGMYKVLVTDLGVAKDDGTGQCNLSPGWGVQRIPRGADAGMCETYWANWGRNRARLEPADIKTSKACTPKRAGFYIHDSTKGYSHGCIEVEPRFFAILRARATSQRSHFILSVKYVPGRATNGGTRA